MVAYSAYGTVCPIRHDIAGLCAASLQSPPSSKSAGRGAVHRRRVVAKHLRHLGERLLTRCSPTEGRTLLCNACALRPFAEDVCCMCCCPCRIHTEPVSDIMFTEEAIFTACSSGAIKCWLRPHVAEEMAAQLQQQGALG